MELKIKFTLWFLILFTLTINCSRAQSGSNQQGIAFTNVSYKNILSDASIDLDIFLPDTNSLKHPVVVIIHGGGWAMGDKSLDSLYYMQRLKSELLKNRFAVVSINYSLVGKEVHLPTPVEDCKDAIRWLRANAEQYKLDTTNIGLWGGSAGGHLALMTAYTTNEQFAGDHSLSRHSARVNYIIDNFGPTNLNDLFRIDLGWFGAFIFRLFYRDLYHIRNKLVFAMTGYELKSDKKKIREVCTVNSPMTYLNKNAVPTIIFHGTDDKVVPISQSKELKKALDNASIENEFITVKDGDHGFNNIPKEELDQLIEKCIVFINRHTKK